MSLNYSEVEEIALSEAPLHEARRQDETSNDIQKPLLLAIDDAAADKDRTTLNRLTKKVAWSRCHPDEMIHVINLCIFLDMVLLARELAYEGRRLFPNDKRLEHFAIVLAPAKVIGTEPASDIGLEASHRWFQENSSQYKGQWIAVQNGELLGVAPTLKKLYDQIGPDKRTSSTIVVKALF